MNPQCGNFKIFVSLRFYVKSNLCILEVQNLLFLHTVKSLLEAAASNYLRGLEVRPLFKGGFYLRAATITIFEKCTH